MSKEITVAVMCYGLYGYDYRMPEEIEGLHQYFHSCAKYISSLHKQGKLSGVVLCGGFTNSQYPNVSEAKTSAQYLLNVLKTIYKVPVDAIVVCLEEQSINTAQNIVSTGYLMTHKDPFTPKELMEALENDSEKARRMRQTKENWHKLSHDVVFTCDRYRWLKVRIMLKLARKLLSGFKLNVVSFHRADIHPNSNWIPQLGVAYLYYRNPDKFFSDLEARR